ncbi:hypothetical protein E1L24_22480 [Salmonella enterica subsp. enterica serovar Braenderup]|nr:hypothetical protein [Salmonella enterica subsp. enterica serovar Braenderup]
MLTIRKESEISNDLFNAPETYKVVTINCVGAMGRGIALACRERYPTLYQDYRKRCRENEIRIGNVYVYPDEKCILLPTKTHWRLKSQVSYVTAGITALADCVENLDTSVAIPPLGMANGWLRPWERQEIFLWLYDKLETRRQHYTLYLADTLYQEARSLIPNSFK